MYLKYQKVLCSSLLEVLLEFTDYREVQDGVTGRTGGLCSICFPCLVPKKPVGYEIAVLPMSFNISQLLGLGFCV